jgi:homoserine kinase
LANHFGKLGWSGDRILTEASVLEGHPDNAAACWLGGFTVATMEAGSVHALRIVPPIAWPVLLAMPEKPLATTAARALLPHTYSREDAVFNIQRASLLTAAFAAGRGDLLRAAMRDRMHQPFRGEICPLLPLLSDLAGKEGVLGVALSGAGPSVLMLIDENCPVTEIKAKVLERVATELPLELIECGIKTSQAFVRAVTPAS